MSSLHYENQLLDAIETMVDNSLSRADFDKTIRAVIQECEDSSTGKYRIKYQDSTFIAYSSNLNVKYADGTQVYILIPKNDMNQTKIILHAVNKETIEYTDSESQNKLYEAIGDNMVNDSKYSLCSYSGDSLITLYDRDNNINLIGYDEVAFADKIQNADGIMIGADFRTNLSTEQQSKGNYGITYEIDFINTITGDTVTRTYTLDINNMAGDPYNFINETKQEVNFNIDTENYKNLKSLIIFAKNFPKMREDKEDDIFISNFQLHASKITSEGYFLGIKMDKKYFDKNDSTDAEIAVNGAVYLDGNLVDREYNYYWFKQNSAIIETSEKYVRYGGIGWECINDIIVTDSVNNLFEYITSANQISIAKANCNNLENKFKLIAVLNDLIIEKEFNIKNYGSEYKLTIESDNGTTFYYDNGNPTLTVKVNGIEDIANFTYKWTRVDNNGQTEVLNETTAENIEYNLAVAGYNMLEAQLKAGTAMPAATQDQLNAYLTTIKKYDTIQRVEKNHIWKTDISIIDKNSNYVCTVFSGNELIGSVIIKLNKINKVEGEYFLSIENGTQTFNYDSNGIAPTSESLDNPITLQPLRISIIDNKGNKFGENLLNICEIKWKIPENSLIVAADSGDVELSYTLEDRYDINKIDNNTIEVEVRFKEKIYYAQTNFTFVKDGEPGTNGTGVICKIVPNLVEGQSLNDYPMLINGVLNYTPDPANKWFKIQIWKNGANIWEGTSSDENVSIVWENLINTYSSTVKDPCSFIIIDNNFSYTSYKDNGANIVKATIEYDGATYYATLPLINLKLDNLDYQVKLLKNTGFRYVMYSNDGKNPKYDNSLPFEIQVLQQINGYIEDVSRITNEYELNYTWEVKGRKYTDDFEPDIHMTLNSQDRNKAFYIPDEIYDGENVSNAIQVIIKKGSTQIAKIHIPIHFYLDRYGISAINGWDGNSIILNQNEGMILTPQVGAGRKDSNNRFTGIVMGAVKENSQAELDEGLLGFANGQRTMFLDAKTGKATFGRLGRGQITIDPSENVALIYGGNYIDSATTGTGMLINLTDASIKWGNRKFSVDNAGNLISTSGTIANWTISADALTQESGSIYLGKKKTAIINSTSRNNIVLLAGNNFGVSASGILYANSAVLSSAEVSGTLTAGAGSKIGPWTVSNSSIWYGNANYGDANGLYFGTSGLSLGSAFKISSAGAVTATSGTIGGWTLGTNAIYSGTNSMSSTTPGTYIGTSGFRNYANANAYVNIQNGTLTANNVHLTGQINATSGTFQNVTIQNSCTVPASTITGVLEDETIPDLSAEKITSGTMSANRISGGALDISTSNGGYLRAGTNTNHPDLSGINVGWGGINMDGHEIGHCSQIGVDTIGSATTGSVVVNTELHVQGGLYYIDWQGNEHNAAGLYQWYASGTDATVWLECGEGLGWKQFIFNDGLLTHVY